MESHITTSFSRISIHSLTAKVQGSSRKHVETAIKSIRVDDASTPPRAEALAIIQPTWQAATTSASSKQFDSAHA